MGYFEGYKHATKVNVLWHGLCVCVYTLHDKVCVGGEGLNAVEALCVCVCVCVCIVLGRLLLKYNRLQITSYSMLQM